MPSTRPARSITRPAAPPAAPAAAPPAAAAAAALALVDAPDPHEQLASLLEAFGGGADELTINIERKKGSRGQIGHLGTIEFDAELFDRVKEQFGGGDYRGRVNVNGKYRRSINFQIAGAPKDPDADDRTPEPAQPSALERMMASLVESQRALLEAVRAPQSGSRLGEFREIAEVMRSMQPATPAAAAPAAAPPSGLSMLNEVMELQDRLAERIPRGGGAPAVDWSTIIQHGVRPLVGVLEKKIEYDREAMHLRRGMRPLPAGDAAAPIVQDETAPEPLSPDAMTLEALAAHVPASARHYLLNCARADKNPELYAELVLDQLPSNVVDALPVLLAPDDAAARLVAAVPAWSAYGEWFGELVTAIRASIAADPEEA